MAPFDHGGGLFQRAVGGGHADHRAFQPGLKVGVQTFRRGARAHDLGVGAVLGEDDSHGDGAQNQLSLRGQGIGPDIVTAAQVKVSNGQKTFEPR